MSFSVTGETLQNRPISQFLICSRRTTCTLRNSIMLSIFGHQPGGFGGRDEVGRHNDGAVLGAQPGQAFVVADLALWQRHHRLQEEIDPVAVDGVADGLNHVARAAAGVLAAGAAGWELPGASAAGCSGSSRRGGWACRVANFNS